MRVRTFRNVFWFGLYLRAKKKFLFLWQYFIFVYKRWFLYMIEASRDSYSHDRMCKNGDLYNDRLYKIKKYIF